MIWPGPRRAERGEGKLLRSEIIRSVKEVRDWLPEANLSNLRLHPAAPHVIEIEQPEGRTDKRGQFVLPVSPPEQNAEALFDQAQTAEETGQIAEAERLYRVLMRCDPTDAAPPVERYRLVDYDDAKDAMERNAKENSYIAATGAAGIVEFDPNYRGKVLQLHFTVEDEGVFTMPWTATITYRPNVGHWSEVICAENIHWYPGQNSAVPQADKPDF